MTSPLHGTGAFDAHGFLADPGWWDRDMALALAAHLGVGPLDEAHWAVLQTLRDDWLRGDTRSRSTDLCRTLGLGQACVRRLFGHPEIAWRIAGLPDPGPRLRADLERTERDWLMGADGDGDGDGGDLRGFGRDS